MGEKWAYDDCSYLCKGLLECKTPFEVFAEMTGKDYFFKWAYCTYRLNSPNFNSSMIYI
ncbi:hypothetical protein [uncultured Gammaproteobacteria bacterium]|nr:hypothetical protein [uncultured Gammaproteobacteria bacterium]